jgi:hypothetical protein
MPALGPPRSISFSVLPSSLAISTKVAPGDPLGAASPPGSGKVCRHGAFRGDVAGAPILIGALEIRLRISIHLACSLGIKDTITSLRYSGARNRTLRSS